MERGTIIYFGGFSLPDKNAAANRVVSNGKIFSSLGFKTVFLGAGYDGNFDGIKEIPENTDMFEESHPKSAKDWAKHLVSTENLKKLTKNYPDTKMIILYNVPFITLLKVKKEFSKKNIKVVYDCTEWTKSTDGGFLKKAFKYFDEFFIRKFAQKFCDGMIVISKTMENAYKKQRNLLRLPPLVDTDGKIWHQKRNENHKDFEFCFVGVPDGKKESLDSVVKSFCRLEDKNIKLRIAGVTEEDFKRLYPEIVLNEKDRERIVFEGKVPHEKAVEFILNCDCYIFIREKDSRNNAGFPTKFAESYTCGVPIITTDVSDVGDYIRNSERGSLIDGISEDEIYKAMKKEIEKGVLKNCTLRNDFHYGTYEKECEKWFEKIGI